MRDLRSELLHEPEDWPPAWRPKPGDILIGTLRRYAQGYTAFPKNRRKFWR
jgi:hypothetical protein